VPDPTSRSAPLASTAPAHPTIPPSDRKAARRARRAELRATAPDPLLTAEEAAAESGRALSTFWRDVRRGTLPAPYYVTPRAPRWRLSELRAVVEAAPRAPKAA
jgi:predicted DNA-binding transcriptional regulator AlpA